MSPHDLDRLEERHIADSLKALALLLKAPAGPAVDVGSGAGLPGIPLAIAQPERPWRLLEPRSRRAGFLDEVVRELGLEVEVVRKTAQEASADARLAGTHAVATARALAAPAPAFDLLLPLIAPGGTAVVWVGERARIPASAGRPTQGLAIIRRDPSPRPAPGGPHHH